MGVSKRLFLIQQEQELDQLEYEEPVQKEDPLPGCFAIHYVCKEQREKYIPYQRECVVKKNVRDFLEF